MRSTTLTRRGLRQRRRVRRRNRRATALLGTLTLAGLALSGLANQAEVAQAAPTGLVAPYTWVSGNFGNNNGGTYLGRLTSMNAATKAVSPYVFCITAGAATPVNPKVSAVKTGGLHGQLGYAMAKHQGESGNYTPQALSYLAHINFDTGNGQSAAAAQGQIQRNLKSAPNGAAIAARATALLKEAAEYSGVPRIGLTWARQDKVNRLQALEVQVRTANDKHRLAAPVTLTLTRSSGTGTATFKESGKTTLTVTTLTNASKTVNVAYSGTGRWMVNASTEAVFPGNGLTIFGETGHQTAIAIAPNTTAAASHTALQVDLAAPTITTASSSTTQVGVGQAVRDKVTVTGGWPGESITVNAELWRVSAAGGKLPAQTNNAPAGAVKVHSVPATKVQLNSAGTGSVNLPAYTLTNAAVPGWYTWRVTTAATSYTRAASAPFSVPAESFQVLAKPVKIETTALVSGSAGPGDAVSDKVQLSGGVAGLTVQVKATLVRLSNNPAAARPAQSTTRPAGAVTVAGPFTQAVTFNAGGNALVQFGPYSLTAADVGWFTWVVEVAPSANGLVTGGASPYGVPAETFAVRAPAGPRVTTQASQQIADAGAALNDHLRLWADPADLVGAPAVIESTLWGPFAAPPAPSDTWPADPALKVGSVSTTMTAPGSATSPDIMADQRGYYVWTAALAEGRHSTYQPVAALAATDGTGGVSLLGAANGLAPSASLAATVELYYLSDEPTAPPPTKVPSGAPVAGLPAGGAWGISADAAGQVPWDGIMDLPDDLFVSAGGQIAAGWYGLVARSAATADMAQLTGSALDALMLVTEEAGQVSYAFGPAGATPGPTASSLSMPSAAAPKQVKVYDKFTSSFGDAVETTLVPYTPQVTTQTSTQVATAGSELTDLLTLSGAAPGTTYQVTSVLYGPFEAQPSPQATVPADAPVVGSVVTSLTADADGQASGQTDGLVVDQEGYYVWVETIPEDLLGSGSRGWTGEFGQASETSVVPWQPVVTSQVDQAITEPGESSFDTLLVSGGQPFGQVGLQVNLYGPLASDPTFDYDGLGTYEAPRAQPNLAQVVPPQSPPADAPVVASWSFDLTLDAAGEAVAVTSKSQLDDGGYYVYSAYLVPVDQAMVAGAERFGEVSETTLVPWQPAVQTKASHQVAEVGAELLDYLEVTNLGQNQATVTALLYGPLPAAPELSATVPPGTPLAGSVELEVTGDGHYSTPTITVQQAGYYTWVETLSTQTGIRAGDTVTAFGITEETTLVNAPPPVAPPTTPPPAPPGQPKTPELPFTGLSPLTWWAMVLAPLLLVMGTVLVRRAYRSNGG